MFNAVRTQNDLVSLLLSNPALASVQVKSLRKMRLDQELDYHTCLTQPRNGRSGAAVIVAQPVASGRHPNVSGPVLDWVFPILCMEEPNQNMDAANGTLLSAEELGQIVMDALQLYADELVGTFAIDGTLKPETEYVLPGVIAYRASFKVVGKSHQTDRCAPVTSVFAGGNCTLACTTAGSSIYYTIDASDDSFPTPPEGGNSAAVLYSAPFPAWTGMIVRAVAYATGYNNSPAAYRVAP